MNRPALVATVLLVGFVTTACPPIDQPSLQRRAEPDNFQLNQRGDELQFEIRVAIPEELAFTGEVSMLVAVDPVPQPEPADTSAQLLGTISTLRPDRDSASGEFRIASIRGQNNPKPPVMTGGFQGGGSGPQPDLGLYGGPGGRTCENGLCTFSYYVRFVSLADIPIEAVWSANASFSRSDEFEAGDRIEVAVVPFEQ